MPCLALALCAVWFVALFVFRTALHWARTGSTGIAGFSGRPGSLPWFAGLSMSLGFAAALAAPVAALGGWAGGELFFGSQVVHILGAASLVLGTAGALLAQVSMGESWRVGVDESETTRLVTSGAFAWVRNPVFSFIGLSLLGLVLLVPNATALLAGLLVFVGIELQVRVVEEPALVRTHGADYRAYAARVGRFVPGIGRLPEAG